MAETKSALSGVVSQLPVDRLRKEAQGLGSALTKQGLSRASKGVESMTGKLNDFAEGKSTTTKTVANVAQGDSPVKAGIKATASKVTDTVKEKLGMGGGSGGKLKVTNILESVDVPVSRDVAYEQWTQFEDFPTFMKKVENVKQEEDEKLTWKAQVFWSHRSWDAEIVEQVPNERIVWKSDGEKGSVDGAITFHELADDLTRIQMVLEYHPKGFFEHTGNLWRAQGRRARLELKHFARHVSTKTLLHQDELDGWKGEIKDGEVVERKDDSEEDEPEKQRDQAGQEESEDSSEDSSEDKSSEKRPARRRSRSAAKKAPAKKAATKKAPTKEAAARKAPAKRTAAAKKSTTKKATSTRSTTKKAPAKKTAAKKAPAKRTAAAKKSTTKKATSTRSTTKKAPAKKTAAKKSSAGSRPRRATSKASGR